MNFRFATTNDVQALAVLNHALIRDEGHRNLMSVAELTNRMAGWLAGEYRAVLFDESGQPIGYALFRRDSEHVYLRQFFVAPEHRRQGIGRAALNWLRANAWNVSDRVRVDVLIGNTTGIAFWRSVSFEDYCVTLELNAHEGC
jgi:GNAT superfamily N-acetyltransferase